MNYTITLIISISIILLISVGIWTGVFEGIGRGAYNLNTWYNGSDSSPDGGIVEDTVQDDDPEDSALAVDVIATITAYTSSPEETSGDECISASQVNLCHNTISDIHRLGIIQDRISFDGIIACPKKYKFGTIVEIENRKYICLDRMNSRYDGQERFDIYFGHDKQGALEFGKRTLNIKIYNNL